MAGYKSEFASGTESIEDGSGTMVDGSVETTPRSASIQFFLVITSIQARRSSE
jgi:hypothetical protein